MDSSTIRDSATTITTLSGEVLANFLPDIITEVNSQKVYTWMNHAGLAFFGDDALGHEASYYFAGDQKTYQSVEPLLQGSSDTIYIESWQRRKDGEKRLLAWWCRSVNDNRGRMTGIVSTAHDITDRYRIEEKLRYGEAQLYNALALGQLGPWEYDVVNDLFTFNDTFYAMFHTTVSDIGSYTMSSQDYAKRFVHPEDGPKVGIEVKKAIEATDPHFTSQVEHRILYADGGVGHIVVRFFIVKDATGKTIKTFGINQDITLRKEREGEVKQAKEELQEKVKQLETFNTMMVDRELRMVELKKEVQELTMRCEQCENKLQKSSLDG